jgi:NADP-dependent 3-hydroxy acid dehydrogenase YdfG
MTLEGKVALITGASRGIGAAVARQLDAQGVKLGLASRSGDDLGLDAVAQPCDVRKQEELDSIVAATVERFGRLDILVANAGVGAYGPFLDLAPEHLDEMIDVNLKGTLYAVRAALPHLIESGAADIVTVASEAGRRGLPFEAVYCASKFGQVGFTRALDHELREHGVRCTNVCPGGVATDFALDEGRGRSPEALPGMMSGDDVAEVVLFVLTRPRNHRILETAFRPVTETSWG